MLYILYVVLSLYQQRKKQVSDLCIIITRKPFSRATKCMFYTLLHRNVLLTPRHRKEALRVLTKCHSILMDVVSAIFDLHSADKKEQLNVIEYLLAEGKLKNAVTYTWKFGLQENFDMNNVKCRILNSVNACIWQ